MSPEDKQMFDDYFDLFSRSGWKRLVDDLKENAESMQNVRAIADEVTLRKIQGKLEVIDNLTSLPLWIENLYDQMTEKDNENL